ncbi:enolase C-terminal domain-like protein [Microbispora bryophytorum]|uniref:enolase C-terminal domain-like protein n=1 Tax=Microbispora bryophytorum TaxID=1460882 RepID=UPI0033FBE040
MSETAPVSVTVDVHARALLQSFQVSHLTTETVDVVRLRLTEPGGAVSGEGEISADAGYGQDGQAIAREARGLAAALAADPRIGDPAHLEGQLEKAAAEVSACALTLVEMAFLDRAARCAGVPVWRLVGLPDPGVVRLMTTVPIGAEPPAAGPMKIKLGGPGDRALLRRLTRVTGPVILDVNLGWDRAGWLAVRDLVAEVAPAVLEDPVSDPSLLAEVRAALPRTRVVLDEGIGSQADVEYAARAAQGANVKVMKLGGLFPARRALEFLGRHGATRMLGCFLEPPTAIAYAAQLNGLADWTDLDGHFWLSPDHPPVPEFRLDDSAPGVPRIAA